MTGDGQRLDVMNGKSFISTTTQSVSDASQSSEGWSAMKSTNYDDHWVALSLVLQNGIRMTKLLHHHRVLHEPVSKLAADIVSNTATSRNEWP